MIMVDELRMWLPRQPRPFHEGSCHLTSDGPRMLYDLHAFAKRLGLKRGWFQDRASWPHYDLTPARRVKALELGAVFVPAKEQARVRMNARRFRRWDGGGEDPFEGFDFTPRFASEGEKGEG